MQEIIFYISMFFVAIESRVHLIYTRSMMHNALSNTSLKIFIEFVSGFSSVAIFIWGIIYIGWWQPILTLIALGFLASSMVSLRTLGLFTILYQLIGIIIVALNLFLWFS